MGKLIRKQMHAACLQKDVMGIIHSPKIAPYKSSKSHEGYFIYVYDALLHSKHYKTMSNVSNKTKLSFW